MQKHIPTFITLFFLSLFIPKNSLAEPATDQKLSQRISMLETALTPKSTEGVASTWADAVKNRNGAVQYMLMCPALQKQHLSNYIDLNWVSGVSSPWIEKDQIISVKKSSHEWLYTIQYHYTDGSKKVTLETQQITIIPTSPDMGVWQPFCIQKIEGKT